MPPLHAQAPEQAPTSLESPLRKAFGSGALPTTNPPGGVGSSKTTSNRASRIHYRKADPFLPSTTRTQTAVLTLPSLVLVHSPWGHLCSGGRLPASAHLLSPSMCSTSDDSIAAKLASKLPGRSRISLKRSHSTSPSWWGFINYGMLLLLFITILALFVVYPTFRTITDPFVDNTGMGSGGGSSSSTRSISSTSTSAVLIQTTTSPTSSSTTDMPASTLRIPVPSGPSQRGKGCFGIRC